VQPTFLLADAALTRVPPRARKRAAAAVRVRWIVLGAVAALVAAALGYLRTWPPLATVMSASMSPTINTGDMVLLRRLGRPARVGDVVMVHVPDEARTRYGYPPVVIHRVVSVAPDGTLTTKGDARHDRDPFTVPRGAVTTSVVAHLPAGGQALRFFGSPLGLLWLASGGALFLAVPLVERYRESQRREEADREALDGALRAAASSQAALREQLEQLPAQIEAAVSAAVAATAEAVQERPATPAFGRLVAASAWQPPAKRPVPVLEGLVAASAWTPPARTPDLMDLFAVKRPVPRWDEVPREVLRSPGVLCA
jgi:signal peptidase I